MSFDKFKMSRRDFLKLSALGAGSTALAACGAKATETPAAEEKPVEGEAPAAAEPVTLRYIHWWCEGDAHTDTLAWTFDEFQKQNPEIKIDSVCVPSEAPDKVATECAAGSCPEIINWASAAQAEAGQLLDISDWMMKNKDRFVWQPDNIQLKLNDKMYGWSAEFGTVPQIWNTRLLEAAGVSEIPMTWEAVVVAAEKLWANKIAWASTTWTRTWTRTLRPTWTNTAWARAWA